MTTKPYYLLAAAALLLPTLAMAQSPGAMKRQPHEAHHRTHHKTEARLPRPTKAPDWQIGIIPTRTRVVEVATATPSHR